MKLLTYSIDGEARLGALSADERSAVSVNQAVRRHLERQGVSARRSAELAAALAPDDMVSFLEGRAFAGGLVDEAVRAADEATDERCVASLESVRLHAPVPRPPKVIGIGGNYPELRETWPEPPAVPPVFQRATSSIVGPADDVVIPAGVTYYQPEMELCVVIGKQCRNVAEEDAESVVAGYMIGNDMSDIDVLMTQWVTRKRPDLEQYGLPQEAPFNLGLAFQSKCWDTSAPTGPFLLTADEDVDPMDLDFEFRLNGELIQTGNTGQMVVTMHALISYLSRVCTLEVGDVIFTGARGLVPTVKDGDLMDHRITELGQFTSKCVAESPGR